MGRRDGGDLHLHLDRPLEPEPGLVAAAAEAVEAALAGLVAAEAAQRREDAAHERNKSPLVQQKAIFILQVHKSG